MHLTVKTFNVSFQTREITRAYFSENELTFSAAIQFNSQARYVKIVGLWMKTDEASIDVRSKRVCNDSVSVSVPSKDLKKQLIV